jgi:hypothetical protein
MKRHCLQAMPSLLVVACGGEATKPVEVVPNQLRVVSGANVSDTIQAVLANPLVIEIKGATAAGITVKLDAVRSTDSTRSLEDAIRIAGAKGGQTSPSFRGTTDASGRITVWPVLGTIAGEARLVVSIVSLGLTDTARYTVMPGVSTAISMKVRDTVLTKGAQYSIGAVVLDRFNNRRAPTFTLLRGGGSVDANGVVNGGNAVGRVAVLVREGTSTDTAFATVIPDDMFLFRQGTGYYRARLDRSQRTEIVNPFGGYGVLSPDGNMFALIMSTFDPSYGTDQGLYLGDTRFPADAPKRLTPRSATAYVTDAAFSPDGQWIYYSGSDAQRYSIWRVKVDGSHLEELAPNSGNQFRPAISPDGTLLAWIAPGHVYVMNLVTRNQVDVRPTGGHYAAFSPDGKRVAIAASILVVVNADGTDRHVYYAPTGEYFNSVAWTKDGQWVIGSANTFTFMTNVATQEVVPVPGIRYLGDIQTIP